MRNELAKNVAAAGKHIQYDTQCKKVISNKVILAWILKRVAEEFKDMTIDEIVSCIEGTPEISSVPVEAGETNAPEIGEQIVGEANEDAVPYEGKVWFDIRFHALISSVEVRIKLLVDVEAQKNFYPGYPVVTRGIFYTARMISAQQGTEFSNSQYGGIKKVYSIWICMNTPAYIGNTISRYHLVKEDLIPGQPDIPDTYDKMSVVIITLNETADSEDEFINMLNTTLSQGKSYEEKRTLLENDFQISFDSKMEKEMNTMCNLSEWVEEIGIEKGEERQLIRMICKKIVRGQSPVQIAELLEEDLQNVERICDAAKEFAPDYDCNLILKKLRSAAR